MASWHPTSRYVLPSLFDYTRVAESVRQLPWVAEQGAATVLGIQAALGAFTALLLVGLQVFGKRIRQRQGPVKRNENDAAAGGDTTMK